MIPSNLAGLVLFVASLGPGYIFVRVVEVGGPRPPRSTFFEAVEMAVVGAVATTIAACVVLAATDLAGWIDTPRLFSHSKRYFEVHPLRVLACVFMTLALSYVGVALPWVVREVTKRRRGAEPAAIHKPGAAGWQEVFVTRRPANTTLVATAELSDGRKVIGQVLGFSSIAHDNRELTLGKPLAGGNPVEKLDDDFIVLREQDIKYVTVRYLSKESGDATNRAISRSTLDISATSAS